LNIDLTAGKKFKLSKDFTLDALVGGNYRKSVQEFVTSSGETFATAFLYNIGNLVSLNEPGYALNNEEFQSLYASADLSYKNWLYLRATGRNDWYSTLSPGKINYLYPSLSASFVFSELLHIPAMDMGKLRLSYAAVGGAADQPYQTLQTYSIQGSLNVPSSPYAYPIGQAGTTTVPNSGLTPSKRQEFEVGTEMDFFKTRLHIDVAVYQKKVIDDIVPVTIDYTSGYSSALLNVGTLRDNGVEVELSGTPIKGHDFSWEINLNGSYNASKIVNLGGQPQITLGSATPDWGSIAYIQQIVGLPSQQIIALTPAVDDKGKIIINPVTAAPDPTASVAKDFGSAIDPWTGGITNTFRYGHFNLSFLIDGKFGGKLFSNTNFVAYVQGLSKLTVPGRNQMYGTEGDYPATYYGNWANADQGLFVYDASFIKFRQIIFGYDFPATFFHKKIQGLRLSFVTRNVFTIMKHTPNIDPEANYSASVYSQGLESAEVPYSRTFGFNLNVKF